MSCGPNLGSRLPEAVVTAHLAEDVQWLLNAGESVDEACHQLGRTPEAMYQRFHRAGLRDLARTVAPAARQVRSRRDHARKVAA